MVLMQSGIKKKRIKIEKKKKKVFRFLSKIARACKICSNKF